MNTRSIQGWGCLRSLLTSKAVLAAFAALFALATFAFVLAPSNAFADKTTEEDTTEIQAEVTRLYGNESYETAAAIAQEWAATGDDDAKHSDWVLIARADDYADAMSACGLAGALGDNGCPIILADRTNGLDQTAISAINAVGAKKAYIIGGKGAIPATDKITSQLSGLGISYQGSIYGNDYYETSVACYQKIKEHTGATPSQAIVAMGSNFQDALSISSFAYKNKFPIFLQTSGNDRGLTQEAQTEIWGIVNSSSEKIKIWVPGGPGAVPKNTVEDIFGESNIQRIYGQDGYDTSVEIAEYMTTNKNPSGEYYLSASTVCLACGAEAPKGTDALAGSALAGKNGGLILLMNTNDRAGDVKTNVLDFLKEATDADTAKQTGWTKGEQTNAKTVQKAYYLGGNYVMPDGSGYTNGEGVHVDQTSVASQLTDILWHWKKLFYNTDGGTASDGSTYKGQATKDEYGFDKVWEGEYASEPEEAPIKEGNWKFDDWYTADGSKLFNFAGTAITEDTTVLAKWKTMEEGGYWIAKAGVGNEKQDIIKVQSEIQEDVAKIKSGDTATIAYYTKLMNDDEYHLYSVYNNGTGTNNADNYIECRIIGVGSHDEGTTAEGMQYTTQAGLAFQMVHCFPAKYTMGGKTSGTTGWSGSELRIELNSGKIKPVFNSSLWNDIISCTKVSMVGMGSVNNNQATKLQASSEKVWLLSVAEITGKADSKGGVAEGTQFDYFKNSNANTTGQAASRSGLLYNSPSEPLINTSWWLRTADASTSYNANFMYVNPSNGVADSSSDAYDGAVAAAFYM